MHPEQLPNINLLPYGSARKSTILYKMFLATLVLVVLLSGLMIFLYFYTKDGLDAVTEQATALETERNTLETSLLKKQAANSDPFVQSAKFADAKRLPASILLAGLLAALPDNSYLSEFNYNLGTVEIKTEFETIQKASVYIAALEKMLFIKDPKVDHVESFSLKNEAIPETGSIPAETRYNVLPRYAVTYTFSIDERALEKEVKQINE